VPDVDTKVKPQTQDPTVATPSASATETAPPPADVLVDPTQAAADQALEGAAVDGAAGTAKGGPAKKPAKKPPFDPYNASPEIRGLMQSLAAATDAEAQKPIIAQLKKAGVPQDVIRGISHGDTGFFRGMYDVAKGPGWHKTTLGEDGNVDKEFHLDQKHIEWEGTDQRFEGNWNDQRATYEHKTKDIKVEAGAKDGGGYATGEWGNAEEDHRHVARAAMTSKDKVTKYGAEYTRTHTGDPDDKTDDTKEAYKAALITGEKGTGAEGSVRIQRGDETHAGSASYVHGEKKQVGRAEYTHTDGKTSEKYTAGITNTETGGTITATTTHKHGEEGEKTTAGTAEVYYGETVGGKGTFKMDREGMSLDASAYGKATENDETDKIEAGGKIKTVLKGEDAKKTDDDVTLSLGGSGVIDNKKGTTTGTGDASVKFGKTEIGADLKHVATDDGATTTVGGDFSHGIKLDGGEKPRVLNIGGSGSYTATSEPDAESTWKAGTSLSLVTGEKKDQTSHSLTLDAEKAAGSAIRKSMGLPDEVPVDGYGHQFSLGTEHKFGGGHTIGTDLSFGSVGDMRMGSLGASWKQMDGKDRVGGADLSLGMATDGTRTGYMGKGAFDLKLDDQWSVGAGGGFSSLSGPAGDKSSFYGYGTAGYNWSKDGGVDLTMGVAGGSGSPTMLLPELGVNINKDVSLSAMGAIPTGGGQASVGGRLKLPAGISVMAGYGDMNALSNPYAGNSGMSFPTAFDQPNQMGYGAPGGGGFVGISADLLKTYRSIFKK
jgi:hypothetical protein